MTDYDPFRELQTWIFEHLQLPLTVEDLALQVHMSPRNCARAFVSQVGVTPARFIDSIRLDAARRRREETDRNLQQIAFQCGFGSEETMRRSFVRNLRTSPSACRARVQTAWSRQGKAPVSLREEVGRNRGVFDIAKTPTGRQDQPRRFGREQPNR